MLLATVPFVGSLVFHDSIKGLDMRVVSAVFSNALPPLILLETDIIEDEDYISDIKKKMNGGGWKLVEDTISRYL
jgi:hypothetical protein